MDSITDRNQYQIQPVTLQAVVQRVKVGNTQDVSPIILAISPCRSGSTVLLRVFGAMGIQAHFQELKNILRWKMQCVDMSWRVPQQPDRPIFLKETLGPYTASESRFNPLQVLLKAGFPPKKLKVIILGRSPLDSWASWMRWWEGRTNAGLFILAYQTTDQVRKQALEYGIPTTTIVYEALRDYRPETIIRRLFGRLGLPFAPRAVRDWKHLPPFGTPGSNIFLPDEPPSFVTPHIHDSAVKSNELEYFPNYSGVASVQTADFHMIVDAGLLTLHDQWRRAAADDLHIEIRQAASTLTA